jgi:hypothetical protein
MTGAYREPERKGVSSLKSAPEKEIKQLVVTINSAMGGIVKLEKIDKAGKHEELSDEECARLVGEDEVDEIQDAIDEAFEAVVMSVIGEEDQAERENDDEEEKVIRRFLINDLLIPSAIRRRVLHRLLLSRMLRRRLPDGQQEHEIRNSPQESTAPRAIPFNRSSRTGKRKQ